MSSYGMRLGFAIGTASLLVGLNAIFVLSGAANAVYGKLPGTGVHHSAGRAPGTPQRYGGVDVVTGSGECGYGGSQQQGLPLRTPAPVYAGTSRRTGVTTC